MKKWIVLVLIGLIVMFVAWWAMQQLETKKNRVAPTTTEDVQPPLVEVDGLAEYCAGTGSKINLRSATRLNKAGNYVPREFTTAHGGELHIVVKDIASDVPLDLGISTRVSIGPVASDWRQESSAAVVLDVREDKYSSFSLQPSTYWLFVSDGGDIDIISCEENNLSLVEYDN
jgi:hypothetical protein